MADETQLLDDDRACYPTTAIVGNSIAGHVRNARLASLRQVLRCKNAALSPTIRQDAATFGDNMSAVDIDAASGDVSKPREGGPMAILGASATSPAGGRTTTRLSPSVGRGVEPITPMVTTANSGPQTALSHISQTQDNNNTDSSVRNVVNAVEHSHAGDGCEAPWSLPHRSGDDEEALVMVAPSDPLAARRTTSSCSRERDDDTEDRRYGGGATQHTLGCTLRVQDLSPRGTLPSPHQLTDNHTSAIEGASAAGYKQQHRQVLGKHLPETVDDGIIRGTMTEEERDEFDRVGPTLGHAEDEGGADSQGQEVELLLTEGDDDSDGGKEHSEQRCEDDNRLAAHARPVHTALSAVDESDAPLIPSKAPPQTRDPNASAPRGGSPPPSSVSSKARNAKASKGGAVGAAQKSKPCFAVGQRIEAKWGAVWYEAIVRSLLGKSVELQWTKDNSVVYVPMKDVRAHKTAPALPQLDVAAQTMPRTPDARGGALSSTQLVRLMDEEDEQHNALRPPAGHTDSRSVRGQRVVPSNNITPIAAAAHGDPVCGSAVRQQPDGASPLPKPQFCTTSQKTSSGEQSTAQQASGSSNPVERPPTTVEVREITVTPSSTLRHGPHQSDVLCDYGDCSTPPATLLYFTDAAVQELPPDTRRRCLRELPRAMVVHGLSDVASWAANSTFQQSVPFIFLASEAALRDPASHEHFCVAVALALGVTPLSFKWITATLRALSLSGGQAPMIPYEPYLLLPDSVRGTTRTPHHRQLSTVRLFPVPRTFRACFGDNVWCPQKDADAELLIEAAGGSILRDVSEVFSLLEEDVSRSARVLLYTPPGRRMGSVLRDPRLENLVQLDLPWVRSMISRHFQQTISTRPVSCATPIVNGGSTAASTTTPSLPKQVAAPIGRVAAPINRCLAMEDSQQFTAAAVDDGDGAARKRPREDDNGPVRNASHLTDKQEEPAAAGNDPKPAWSGPPEVPLSQQQLWAPSVCATPAAASKQALGLRRRLQHDLRIVVPKDETSCSQLAPPPPHAPSLVIQHDELTTTSTPNGYPVTVGDDYYFVLPLTDAHDDAAPDEEVMAMGRVAAVHAGGHVTMRLYELTSIALRRPKLEIHPYGGGGVHAGPTRNNKPAGQSTRRFTTMVLTEQCVTIPTTSLDVETPLFVVDEHLLEHVYILQRRPDQSQVQVGLEGERGGTAVVPIAAGHRVDEQNNAKTPSKISVTIRGYAKEIQVGSRVECRALPSVTMAHSTSDVAGHALTVHGIVQGFKRDESAPDINFIVVGLHGANDFGASGPSKAPASATAVVTADMIVNVS